MSRNIMDRNPAADRYVLATIWTSLVYAAGIAATCIFGIMSLIVSHSAAPPLLYGMICSLVIVAISGAFFHVLKNKVWNLTYTTISTGPEGSK